MSSPLRCPVCRRPLQPHDKGARCESGHSFDRARQGYLNLLPVQKKRSANPGDNPEMVQARNRFLDTGCYQEPANALKQAARELAHPSEKAVFIDAGCGEGYYTEQLAKAFPLADMTGFDISKSAVQACCRRIKSIQWLVASVADIPLADNSADIIVSVFSRIDWAEFGRVLSPGGHALILGPGPDHLLELRQQIYDEVRPYQEDKLLTQLPDEFELVRREPVSDTIQLEGSQTIQDLLAMTPHYWHIKPAQREQLQQLEQLTCRIDMRLYVVKYQPCDSASSSNPSNNTVSQ
ncbi:methyltransferase domain-containing protein [Sansalvadorimonas sp. 2012CJ34-2]|uniref:Methyltransferase domain-containing protein n=1 Tax=Parendozoicomonas callyspongiae TaxID=2942213 RepID=A0ABT0PHV4_9GAMM|nr:methyltransferase domain-containing protein [Sansalvadorimonas sp. 2012CJ34-2]MCL6270954.1 methyltransferase domain-containing protein [Sansalvadorimonas sp. 2012CJ34-2]